MRSPGWIIRGENIVTDPPDGGTWNLRHWIGRLRYMAVGCVNANAGAELEAWADGLEQADERRRNENGP